MSEQYNGWTNYETWAANLWMDEYGLGNDVAEWAEGASRDNEDKRDAVTEVAEMISDFFEEQMPEVQGLYADLLNAAMREINWREIAEHAVDEVWDEVKAEAEEDED